MQTQARVFYALAPTRCLSRDQLVDEVGTTPDAVTVALVKLRKRGLVAVTGNTWSARWCRVPGAEYVSQVGKNPVSRGNLRARGKPKAPPPLTWDNLMGGA